MAPGKTVQLKGTFKITCNNVVTNDKGEVVELHVTQASDEVAAAPTSGKKKKKTKMVRDAVNI